KKPTMKLNTKNLTHFLLIGVVACAVALAGGTALAADAKPNPITAIDILLEPDATMIEHATATNERLLKVFPKGLALDASHRPALSRLRFGVRAEAFRRELSSARHHRPRPAGIPRQDAQGTVRGVHLLPDWRGRLPPRPLRHRGEETQGMGFEALS